MTDDSEQLVQKAQTTLEDLIQAGGLDATVTRAAEDADTVTLGITGPDAPLFVGPRGQVLDALQHLLLLMIRQNRDAQIRITVDADGYRARRAQTLTRFAHDLAAQVIKSGEEAVTDPLNPLERRIIHTALADHPDVQTYSEGMEPNRIVVVSPRPQD